MTPVKNQTGGLEVLVLDQMKQRIRDRLAKTGLSANAAGRKAGLGLSYVNDLLAGKSKNPVPHRLAMLADVLECDVEYLTGEQDSPRKHIRFVNPHPEPEQASEAKIELHSVGFPDAEGFFRFDGNSVEGISLGAMLAKAGAYAVIVPDDANAPRYFAGEVVVTNPARPVSRGGFAVIRMKDGRATIRRVEAIHHDRVVVAAIGAEGSVEIPRESVEAVHKIVGSAELSR